MIESKTGATVAIAQTNEKHRCGSARFGAVREVLNYWEGMIAVAECEGAELVNDDCGQ